MTLEDLADNVYRALISNIPSESSGPFAEYSVPAVAKHLKWFLKRYNETWTGGDGKLPRRQAKLSCSFSELCSILGPSKMQRIDESTVRVFLPPADTTLLFCQVCSRQLRTKTAKEQHDASEGHKLNLRKHQLINADSSVSLILSFPDHSDGQQVILGRGELFSGTLIMRNLSTTPIRLITLRTFPQVSETNISFSGPKLPLSIGANSSGLFTTKLQFSELTADKIGIVADFEVLDASGTLLKTSLKMFLLDFIVVDQVVRALAPTKPFARPIQPPKDASKSSEIIDGEKPETETATEYKNPLLYQKPPHDLVQSIKSKRQGLIKKLGANASPLQLQRNMLWLEELQLEENVLHYSMKDATMQQRGQYLGLRVEGLAEKRPSVLRGDSVLASRGGEKKVWRGYVHVVEQNTLLLRFRPDFHRSFVSGQKFNIQFCINNTPSRRCHTAVTIVEREAERWADRLNPSFPPEVDHSQIPLIKSWNNRLLNDRQKQAVRFIVNAPARAAPYVLFGPAGTGKTTTLIEAIWQVRNVDTRAKILVVAPSNSAADLLAKRLAQRCGVKPMDMLRLNALSRQFDTVDPDISSFCFSRSANAFDVPPIDQLRQKSIIVSTNISAGLLYAVDIGSSHFTHIFVDEASQATEPENLVALAGISDVFARFVLAGDPEQLGPVIHSVIARRLGFDRPMLERLFRTNSLYIRNETDFAEYGGFNPLMITKLVDNYRSHPAILSVPSRLFYDNELNACADPVLANSFLGWNQLPNKKVPVIFHAINHTDQREENSPSFFNPGEASVVVDYVRKILEYKSSRITPKDIGIITPYHKQVQKIRQALTDKKLYDPKSADNRITVASVEEFQGQERRVIIISTVRSSHEWLAHDGKFNLGFVRNPKRLNVSITRPQALLIVIGSPNVLYHDPNWRALITHCRDNACYVGPEPPKESSLLLESLPNPDADIMGTIDEETDRAVDRNDKI